METTPQSERDVLVELRRLITEFLYGGEGTPEVREYIASVYEDDSKLLIYLKGRKYRVNHAWETLKRKAEIICNDYPEYFPETLPKSAFQLINNHVYGALKARDKLGRRIICFNAGKWDPKEISVDELAGVVTHHLDLMLTDEDVLSNGIVYIQNCEDIGMKHVKEYSLHRMLRMLDIFCYAYPIQIKGIYYLNVPFYARYVYKIIRPFLPKKIKERLIISSNDQKFAALHDQLSPRILPKFLGGHLENEEAFDMTMLQHLQ
ncbi:Retinaldehyde-binding protein 1 [Orchesella cincta]|uniref:Retinaldehyde-binding protein 1 n=1 Tax=Orchesella cincta TaxID=48709 RepID=A0A1D2M7I2_ORCCI|nr:Retinaldehyde-binding protein 1 [Orchesella cincta]